MPPRESDRTTKVAAMLSERGPTSAKTQTHPTQQINESTNDSLHRGPDLRDASRQRERHARRRHRLVGHQPRSGHQGETCKIFASEQISDEARTRATR